MGETMADRERNVRTDVLPGVSVQLMFRKMSALSQMVLATNADDSLVKSSASDFSLTKLKVFDAFLYFACQQLREHPERRKFSVPFVTLRKLVGLKSKNIPHLTQSILGLMDIKVQPNALGKDKMLGHDGQAVWERMVLIPYAKVSRSGLDYTVHFELPELVRDNLLNPNCLYAHLDLSVISELSSKYSLLLYYLCRDYANVEIPRMPLCVFRSLMFVAEDEYAALKDFRRRVLEPAVKEVSERSDMIVSYEIEEGRAKGTERAIKLRVAKKKGVVSVSRGNGGWPEIASILGPLAIEEDVRRGVLSALSSEGVAYVKANVQHALKIAGGVGGRGVSGLIITALKDDLAQIRETFKRAAVVNIQKRKDMQVVDESLTAEERRVSRFFDALSGECQASVVIKARVSPFLNCVPFLKGKSDRDLAIYFLAHTSDGKDFMSSNKDGACNCA